MSNAKHRLLNEAARRCGSQAALAAYIGVGPTVAREWVKRAGTPRISSASHAVQRRLLAVTGRTVDELWPPQTVSDPLSDDPAEGTAGAPILTELALEIAARNTLPSPEEVAALSDDCDLLREALATLTDKQRAIVVRHFGLLGTSPQSLKQIGCELGCTAEAIRQTEEKALLRMRHYFERPVGRRFIRCRERRLR